MMYNKVLEDCFFSLNHGGCTLDEQKNTVCYQSQLPGPSGSIEISIQCDEGGLISRACFRAQGNPYLLAALEWVCRQIEGEPLSLHPRLDYQQLVDILEMPTTQYPVAIRVENVYRDVISRMQQQMKEVKS